MRLVDRGSHFAVNEFAITGRDFGPHVGVDMAPARTESHSGPDLLPAGCKRRKTCASTNVPAPDTQATGNASVAGGGTIAADGN